MADAKLVHQKLKINGALKKFDADPEMPLLWVLRDVVGMHGTKYGCGKGLCGTCTVHVDGKPVRSCQLKVSEVKGEVITIEGLGQKHISALQQAWMQVDTQCGYCQPGQIMAAAALLKKHAQPTDAQIDEAMDNLCRCGSYAGIRQAIHKAAKA